VFFTLVGQRLGLGSSSDHIRVLALLKTACHLATLVLGARAQGYIVRILLVDLVQVLLVAASAVMHAVEDYGGMRLKISLWSVNNRR